MRCEFRLRYILYWKMPPRLILYWNFALGLFFLFISHFTRFYLLATLPRDHLRGWSARSRFCVLVLEDAPATFSVLEDAPATFSVLEDAPATFFVLEDAPGSDFFYLLATLPEFI